MLTAIRATCISEFAMAFVNLSLLLGTLLIGIPILLHLVMRQKPKQAGLSGHPLHPEASRIESPHAAAAPLAVAAAALPGDRAGRAGPGSPQRQFQPVRQLADDRGAGHAAAADRRAVCWSDCSRGRGTVVLVGLGIVGAAVLAGSAHHADRDAARERRLADWRSRSAGGGRHAHRFFAAHAVPPREPHATRAGPGNGRLDGPPTASRQPRGRAGFARHHARLFHRSGRRPQDDPARQDAPALHARSTNCSTPPCNWCGQSSLKRKEIYVYTDLTAAAWQIDDAGATAAQVGGGQGCGAVLDRCRCRSTAEFRVGRLAAFGRDAAGKQQADGPHDDLLHGQAVARDPVELYVEDCRSHLATGA